MLTKNWKHMLVVLLMVVFWLPLIYAFQPVSVYPHPRLMFAYWYMEIGIVVFACGVYIALNWNR